MRFVRTSARRKFYQVYEGKRMKQDSSIKKRKKRNWGDIVFIISFIILPITYFLVFYIYVNLNSFLMGFQLRINGHTEWTLENFRRFFSELSESGSDFRIIFRNTFITFGINFIIFPWGVVVSYFLYKKIWGAKIFRVAFCLLMIIPAVVTATVYKEMVSVNGFIAKGVQKMLGLDYTPDLLASTQFANYVIWAKLLWVSFSGDIIIWGGAYARIPDSVLEAAKLDGVGWIREIVSIIIPMIWPTFILKYVILFSGLFSSSGDVFLLTRGEYGTNTFANWMYLQVYNNRGSVISNAYNYLSAVGLLVTAVAIAISATIRKIANKINEGVTY